MVESVLTHVRRAAQLASVRSAHTSTLTHPLPLPTAPSQSLTASELGELLTPKPLDEINKDIISDKDLKHLLLQRQPEQVLTRVCASVCECVRMCASVC